MRDKFDVSTTAALTGIITLLVSLCGFSPKVADVLVPFSAMISPFIASFSLRLYRKYDIPEDLGDYKNSLTRALKTNEKLQKNPMTSTKEKKRLKTEHDEIVKKLSSADLDYALGKLNLTANKSENN